MTLSDSHKSTTEKLLARLNVVAACSEAAVAASDAPRGGIAGSAAGGHGATGGSSGIEAASNATAGGNGHRGGKGAAGKGKEDMAARWPLTKNFRGVGACRSRSSKLVMVSLAVYSRAWIHTSCWL